LWAVSAVGLGHVNVLTSVFFAGISGSAIADSAALSRTFVPEMKTRGYDALLCRSAITAASSMIGPIIPPSIIMIIYGGLTGTSVAALFIAGVVPGAVTGGSLDAAQCRHRNCRRETIRAENPMICRVSWPSLLHAAPALCLPVVILGSLVFGLATPTEGSAIAVVVRAAWQASSMWGSAWSMIFDAVEATARDDRNHLHHSGRHFRAGIPGRAAWAGPRLWRTGSNPSA
jgi:tripartite ATP-independent transporter DctM subunit